MKKIIIIFTLIADIALVTVVMYLILESNDTLIYLRQALYVKISDSPEVFKLTKREVKEKYNFLVEKADVINDYFKRLKEKVDFLTPDTIYKINQIDNIVEKAQQIALLYSKNGGPGCADYKNLIHNIQRLNRDSGKGCCSDHSDAFIALSHIFRLNSREVHHLKHTFNEFYDLGRKKWIWIDTQFALMAMNENKEYLSLLDMMERIKGRKKIFYSFFGNSSYEFSRTLPEHHEFYNENKVYSHIILTMGDNIFSQDRFASKIGFLPKSVRQFIALNLGIQPTYILYTTKLTEDLKKQTRLKYMLPAVILLYIILNMFILLQLVFYLILRRNRITKV